MALAAVAVPPGPARFSPAGLAAFRHALGLLLALGGALAGVSGLVAIPRLGARAELLAGVAAGGLWVAAGWLLLAG